MLAAIITLGILIVVHEFGHFIVAKASGVLVEKFSVGFGPKILSRKYGETEYQLALIPLGGFVKMYGEQLGDEVDDTLRHRAFPAKPLWIRTLIVAAGPVANFILAVIVFMVLAMYGTPSYAPVVGKMDNATMQQTGLAEYDRIVLVNGEEIIAWSQFEDVMRESAGKTIELGVQRGEETTTVSVPVVSRTFTDPLGDTHTVGDIPGLQAFLPPILGSIREGMPAAGVGLKAGDVVVSLDGQAVTDWTAMSAYIKSRPDKPVQMTVQRGEETVAVTLKPKKTESVNENGEKVTVGLIGVTPPKGDVMVRSNPVEALSLGIERTGEMVRLIFVSMAKLIDRSVPADSIGGPIVIVQMAADSAEVGFASLMAFMAVISINLAVLNLLPIPVLDGGHLLFFAIEAITRRPVSIRVREIAQTIGIMLIGSLMFFAFYNDITRLFFK